MRLNLHICTNVEANIITYVFELPLLLVHASQHYTQLMLHQTGSVIASR